MPLLVCVVPGMSERLNARLILDTTPHRDARRYCIRVHGNPGNAHAFQEKAQHRRPKTTLATGVQYPLTRLIPKEAAV